MPDGDRRLRWRLKDVPSTDFAAHDVREAVKRVAGDPQALGHCKDGDTMMGVSAACDSR